jgi:hypothetical protein
MEGVSRAGGSEPSSPSSSSSLLLAFSEDSSSAFSIRADNAPKYIFTINEARFEQANIKSGCNFGEEEPTPLPKDTMSHRHVHRAVCSPTLSPMCITTLLVKAPLYLFNILPQSNKEDTEHSAMKSVASEKRAVFATLIHLVHTEYVATLRCADLRKSASYTFVKSIFLILNTMYST